MEGNNNDSSLSLSEFNTLYRELQSRFIRFATSYTTDTVIAEDIVMDSFVAAWENRAILTKDSFAPYTLTIVKNKCLNHLRSRNTQQRVKQDITQHNDRMLQNRIATLEACDPQELFSSETQKMINDAIAALPKKTREIFVRSRFDGQSYKEIAAEMDITTKSVEFEVSKAVKALRISLRNCAPAILIMLNI